MNCRRVAKVPSRNQYPNRKRLEWFQNKDVTMRDLVVMCGAAISTLRHNPGPETLMQWLQTIGVNLDFLPHLASLVSAYILALPIGWDRERHERSAGLRTFPLVAIASCGFVQAAEPLLQGNAEATARIVEGLITGMGFIGGGAILVVKNSVRGTATAASLWATGAIGTAVGLGSYNTAIVLSVVTFATLRAMSTFKDDPDEDAKTE